MVFSFSYVQLVNAVFKIISLITVFIDLLIIHPVTFLYMFMSLIYLFIYAS